MRRTMYDEDYEAFHNSVRTWLERSVIPNSEKHIAAKAPSGSAETLTLAA